MQGRYRVGGVIVLALGVLLMAAWGVAAQGPTGSVIGWLAGGTPDDTSGRGEIARLAAGQAGPVTLAEVPGEGAGTRLLPCGAAARHPDGEYVVAYIGNQTGGLYRLPLDGDAPATLDHWGDASALACNGPGRAAFNTAGDRWAYLHYPASAITASYPAGELRVIAPRTGEEIALFEDVVAFAWHEDGLYLVQFFPDTRGRADEAALHWWPGDGESRELTTFTPAADCNWRTVSLAAQPGTGEVALSFAELCAGGSRWRLFTATPDGETSEHVYMAAGGAYFSDAYIDQIDYLADGRILATYPNGRARNLANLVWVSPAANAVTRIAEEVIVDTYPDGTAMHMRRAPDGETLAYVTATANGEYAIHRLSLTGDPLPLSIEAGPRGDIISAFFFTPDGALVYVAGGADGADNALWLLPPDSDEPLLVRRGRYARDIGLAGNNDVALLLEHVSPDANYRGEAVNLVAVALEANGAQTVLLEGREADAWALPLAWR